MFLGPQQGSVPGVQGLSSLDSAAVPGWDLDTAFRHGFAAPADDPAYRARKQQLGDRQKLRAETEAAIAQQRQQPWRQHWGSDPEFMLGTSAEFFQRLQQMTTVFNQEVENWGQRPRGRTSSFAPASASAVAVAQSLVAAPIQPRMDPMAILRQQWGIAPDNRFVGIYTGIINRELETPPPQEERVNIWAFNMPGDGLNCMFYAIAFCLNVLCRAQAELDRCPEAPFVADKLRQEAAEICMRKRVDGQWIVPDEFIEKLIRTYDVEIAGARIPRIREQHRVAAPIWNGRDSPLAPQNPGDGDMVRIDPLYPDGGAVPREFEYDKDFRPWSEQRGVKYYYADQVLRYDASARQWRLIPSEIEVPLQPIHRVHYALEHCSEPGLVLQQLSDEELRYLYYVESDRQLHADPTMGRDQLMARIMSMRNAGAIMADPNIASVVANYMFPGLSIAIFGRPAGEPSIPIKFQMVADNRLTERGTEGYYEEVHQYRTLADDKITVAIYNSGLHWKVIGVERNGVRSFFYAKRSDSAGSSVFRSVLGSLVSKQWGPVAPGAAEGAPNQQEKRTQPSQEEMVYEEIELPSGAPAKRRR